MTDDERYLAPHEVINLSEDGKYLVYCKATQRVHQYDPYTKRITLFALDESGAIKIGN